MTDYAKCKVAELKKLLKERGQSGAGEKEELVTRLKLCEAGEKHKLPDGRNPTALKAAEFRKLLAQRGLPCDLSIEPRDELMQRLLDALQQEGGSSKRSAGEAGLDEAGGAAGGAAATGEDAEALATRLAEQVLELAEGGDPEGVLSLLGQPISRSTPFAQQRKVYLNIARMIHPDKLPRYQQATKAFQALVRAFEVLTSPEPPPEATAAAKARAKSAISRSNERCFKTEIHCPRCKATWGTADSGVQPFDYNFMMQGLKTYCCALCLCEFGCMTAEHRCPLCKKGFECASQPRPRLVPTCLLTPAPRRMPPAPRHRSSAARSQHRSAPPSPCRPPEGGLTLTPTLTLQTTRRTTTATWSAAARAAAAPSASGSTTSPPAWRTTCGARPKRSRSGAQSSAKPARRAWRAPRARPAAA
jgi:hypothetical protein